MRDAMQDYEPQIRRMVAAIQFWEAKHQRRRAASRKAAQARWLKYHRDNPKKQKT
jgi:hypothetical protein